MSVKSWYFSLSGSGFLKLSYAQSQTIASHPKQLGKILIAKIAENCLTFSKTS